MAITNTNHESDIFDLEEDHASAMKNMKANPEYYHGGCAMKKMKANPEYYHGGCL